MKIKNCFKKNGVLKWLTGNIVFKGSLFISLFLVSSSNFSFHSEGEIFLIFVSFPNSLTTLASNISRTCSGFIFPHFHNYFRQN